MTKFQSFNRGDVIWTDISPSVGRELRGVRPVIILTPEAYNRRSGLAVICPITSKSKGYPFEVDLPLRGSVQGVALCDQILTIDIKRRSTRAAGQVTSKTLGEIEEKLKILLQFS